jgi:hypothetical protein
MAVRSTHRKPGKKPYTVTCWMTDAEAQKLDVLLRQWKALKARPVSRSRSSK